ncbi:NCS2 family permease [Alkalicella caledoniensis]|uniref:NCS2 family permease n=1 Tax=Alkalicella caledoniensis TaxID=2731377 RepID=A0A7G9W982_ALKCA|nr:NCS2 family permease [Alkalicella caledoniensis]QNO15244.1 NCS2 family permease [Alkalicella caledoniensis]
MEKFFKIKERGSNTSTEILAGITTFMTMAYILFVNPDMLSTTGMPFNSLVTATALAAALSTILMGLFTNYPFALASGMGLNAFFAFTIAPQYGWEVALGAVFISGIVFLILAFGGIIEKIDEAVPKSLKAAVSVGIGLFIALIGFKNAGIIIPYEATLVSLGDLTYAPTTLAIIGLFLTAALISFRIKGGLLIGIVATTIIGIPMGVTNFENINSFKDFFAMPTLEGIAFKLDIRGAFSLGFMTIFSLVFIDLFDTMGTLLGTGARAGYLDDKGRLPKVKNAMLVDAVGTMFGAMVGTSTVTTYVESTAGVAQGGRTGLASVVTGSLFAVALFLAPLIGIVPSAATAPALIIVGVLMMGAIKEIDFEDFTNAFPAFMTIVFMPFTFSIADGISAGFLAYPIVKVAAGKHKEVHWFVYILAAISLFHFVGGYIFG